MKGNHKMLGDYEHVFRAWLHKKPKDGGQMLYWQDLEDNYTVMEMFNTGFMTLMEFTGLQTQINYYDSMRRGVFEGDIVSYDFPLGSALSPATTLTGIVHYRPSEAVWVVNNSGLDDVIGLYNGRVLGNIFENPELFIKLRDGSDLAVQSDYLG